MTSRDAAAAYVASNGVVNVSDLPQDIAKAMGVDVERMKKRKKRKKSKEKEEKNGVARGDASLKRKKIQEKIQAPVKGFKPPLRRSGSADCVTNRNSGLALVDDDHEEASPAALMRWLIAPVSVKEFMNEVYEKRALLIQRGKACKDYYSGWMSINDVKQIIMNKGVGLRDHVFNSEALRYGHHIDVVRVDGKTGRKLKMNCNDTDDRDDDSANSEDEADAHNDEIDPKIVLERFECHGYSLRFLHPQRFSRKLKCLLSAMEAFWGTCAGCNAYLTPRKSQGFRAHYDDIDAFILQVEGAKRWRLFHPSDEEDVLPRFSSQDFQVEGSRALGACVLDVVLQPGDMLYMPRGMIHEAVSGDDSDSLHLTLSVNQRQTFLDLMQNLVSGALSTMASSDTYSWLKKTLPRQSLTKLGVMYTGDDDDDDDDASESMDPFRAAFLGALSNAFDAISSFAPVDAAMDQMGKAFLLSRLRPLGAASGVCGVSHVPYNDDDKYCDINIGHSVRLRAPHSARLIVEDDGDDVDDESDSVSFVHCHANDSFRHAEGGTCSSSSSIIKFDIEDAPILEHIIRGETLHLTNKRNVHVAKRLYIRGALVKVDDEPAFHL